MWHHECSPNWRNCSGRMEVAKDFGEDEDGFFQGVVVSVWFQGKRRMYHVEYEDGDEEDLNERDYERDSP